jgi:hypothetical protein
MCSQLGADGPQLSQILGVHLQKVSDKARNGLARISHPLTQAQCILNQNNDHTSMQAVAMVGEGMTRHALDKLYLEVFCCGASCQLGEQAVQQCAWRLLISEVVRMVIRHQDPCKQEYIQATFRSAAALSGTQSTVLSFANVNPARDLQKWVCGLWCWAGRLCAAKVWH